MTAPLLDPLPALRALILDESDITDALAQFNSEAAVFTRRPIPEGASYPLIIVGPVVGRTQQDGISDYRPTVLIDAIAYGHQPDQYRTVEMLGELLYELFHRQERSLEVDGYGTTLITCDGPVPAPTDDDQVVARRVSLTIQLAAR